MARLKDMQTRAISKTLTDYPMPTTLDIQRAEVAALTSTSMPELAETLGIDLITLKVWTRKSKDFYNAINSWETLKTFEIKKAMAKRAVGFTKTTRRDVITKAGTIETLEVETYYPPDPTAGQFWLKNKSDGEFQDKKEVDVNVVANIRQWLVEAGPSDPTEVIDGTAKLISHEIEEAVFEAVDDGQARLEEEMLHSVQAEVESSLNAGNADKPNDTPNPRPTFDSDASPFSAFNKGWS